MELRKRHIPNYMICFSLFFISSFFGTFSNVEAYKNYTVGDSLGWFDKLAKPSVDYDKWASGKTFSLGDFLSDDNVQWSNIDPNSTVVRPITVAVPLLKEGATYFFSGDYDGEQCMNGQKFSINVTHGQGLPPSIKNNPDFGVSGPTSGSDAAPGPADPDSGDDEAAPDTVISSDFNHPKKVPSSEDSTSSDEEDDEGSEKSSGVVGLRFTWELLFVSVISGVVLLYF